MSPIPPKPAGNEGSGNVQRRIAGAAPELGKVGRVVTEPRRKRRSKHGGGGRKEKRGRRRRNRSSKILAHWLILILSITGLGFGTAVIWSMLSQDNLQQPGLITSARDDLPSLDSATALAMADQLLSADGPADLEALILPGNLSTKQAFDYLELSRETDGEHRNTLWAGTIDSMSIPIELVRVRYRDAKDRLILFAQDSNEDWRIDFDAFSRHCMPPIDSLTDPANGEALVRVLVSQDTYYNDPFGDDSEWACYLMGNPDSHINLYGYCKRGTRVHRAMQAIESRVNYHMSIERRRFTPRQLRSSRATLRINRLPGAEIKQFEILEVVSDDWVITDTPFDLLLDEKLESISQS